MLQAYAGSRIPGYICLLAGPSLRKLTLVHHYGVLDIVLLDDTLDAAQRVPQPEEKKILRLYLVRHDRDKCTVLGGHLKGTSMVSPGISHLGTQN
jgi:hypothetical protein